MPTTFANTNDKISFFFEEPSVSPERRARDGVFSVLYLLRRELMETAGFDPNAENESNAVAAGVRYRLFASSILMFTGIDLLSKFGSDEKDVGKRFKEFLKSENGGELDAHTADLLYAVRNSMVHAFGTPDVSSLKRLGLSSIALEHQKMMTTSLGSAPVVATSNGDVAVVYVNGLYHMVRDATRRLYDSLFGSDSADARARFELAFDTYGTITVREN